MQRQDFLRAVMAAQKTYPDQRMGQTMFNVAWAEPELRERVDELRGSSFDPFFEDDHIDMFLFALFGVEQ